MRLYGRDFQGFAKWLVLSATALLIASGLCGLQFAIANVSGNNSDFLQVLFILTGLLELAVMAVSAACIVFVAIAWPILALIDRLTASDPDPPTSDENSKPTEDEEQL